jgi:putative endonuclease
MKGYMYILLCSNGQYYTGSTNDIERRLVQHQEGEGSNFTRKHLPVKLVYLEEFDRFDEAFHREKQVQGWSRKKKEALIKIQYDKLPELSKNSLRRAQGPHSTDKQAQRPKLVVEHKEPDTEHIKSDTELVEVSQPQCKMRQ